ncbi:MAG: hypothetical protein HC938_06110 [Nitrospira sp.]|nr:hypothetical protein [Nitrospira sp.]
MATLLFFLLFRHHHMAALLLFSSLRRRRKGALKVTATATAITAINMVFITKSSMKLENVYRLFGTYERNTASLVPFHMIHDHV